MLKLVRRFKNIKGYVHLKKAQDGSYVVVSRCDGYDTRGLQVFYDIVPATIEFHERCKDLKVGTNSDLIEKEESDPNTQLEFENAYAGLGGITQYLPPEESRRIALGPFTPTNTLPPPYNDYTDLPVGDMNTPEHPKECQHIPVEVGFNHSKIVCKICDKELIDGQ